MSEAAAQQRVLVVDDEPVVRLLACEALRATGFATLEAENGEQGLACVEAQRADLVLLDVELPGMDGYETCRRMRALDEDLPILFATGHTDGESIDRAFEAGATDFISKPLDWLLLRHRIRFLMRANQAFADLRHTMVSLSESEVRLANAQRLAKVGNWEWTPGEEDMLWSLEMYRIFGMDMRPGTSTYGAFLEAVHPGDRAEIEKAMQESARERKPWSVDHRLLLADGRECFVHHQAVVIAGRDGLPWRLAGTVQDITERRRQEERIRQLAYYDSLTGLPNRRMLHSHMKRLLLSARQRDRVVALLFIDLDRFKRINDTMGHATGDQLLRAVATRLVEGVRATDIVLRTPTSSNVVSRLGGDEFTVVLNQIRSADEAALVARRVLEAVREPFVFQGQSFVMGASIGIAMYPDDGTDADALLRNADSAMYHAKEAGRNSYRFFRESMNEEAVRSLRLEQSLRRALEEDGLELHYQALVGAEAGTVIAAEALARWASPDFGEVGPAEFVPLAEETGLIEPLGAWVLNEACRQQRAWLDAGVAPVRMAVNVSSRQLVKRDFAKDVSETIEAYRLDPAGVELEITESALMDDEPALLETLHQLKEVGVRLALDDFGTGYSSLSRLFRFPIDTIKIDQSFVREIGSETKPDAIIAAVTAMAHRLGLTVAAEGVETESQAAFLRAEGCDLFQGYLFARPLRAREFPGSLGLTRPDGD